MSCSKGNKHTSKRREGDNATADVGVSNFARFDVMSGSELLYTDGNIPDMRSWKTGSIVSLIV